MPDYLVSLPEADVELPATCCDDSNHGFGAWVIHGWAATGGHSVVSPELLLHLCVDHGEYPPVLHLDYQAYCQHVRCQSKDHM